MDEYFLECLPDTLAEALDIISAVPKEEKDQIPRIKEIAEYAAALAEICR